MLIYFSGAIDGWTEDKTRRKYIVFVLQYIVNTQTQTIPELLLKHKIVFLTVLEGSHTAERLLEHLVQCLAERGFPEPENLLRKTMFVTDGGSDIVAALAKGNIERIYCFAHYLNICQANAFTIKIYQLNISSRPYETRVTEWPL